MNNTSKHQINTDNPLIDYDKIDKMVDKYIRKISGSQREDRNGETQSHLLLFSGGSASNVGALISIMADNNLIPTPFLNLDSESVIENGIIKGNAADDAKGIKHPEKLTEERKEAFRDVLEYATNKAFETAEIRGLKPTILVDDHFENVKTAENIIDIARSHDVDDTKYVVSAIDPRTAIRRQEIRAENTGLEITPDRLLPTYLHQPDNWETLSKIADSSVMYQNNADFRKPKKVAYATKETHIVVKDPDEYYSFMTTRDIDINAKSPDEVYPNDRVKPESDNPKKQLPGTVIKESSLIPDQFMKRITKNGEEEFTKGVEKYINKQTESIEHHR